MVFDAGCKIKTPSKGQNVVFGEVELTACSFTPSIYIYYSFLTLILDWMILIRKIDFGEQRVRMSVQVNKAGRKCINHCHPRGLGNGNVKVKVT